MTRFMCTYAFDSETVVVFNFDLVETDDMEEAIGEALCQIARENPDVSRLVGFSVLRLDG